MATLVLNCGSSSLKYQVFDIDGSRILQGSLQRVDDFNAALAQVLAETSAQVGQGDIQAVGHRVVHGGERFHEATLIDDNVLAEIERCVPLAPLHNPANLAGIRAAQAAWPALPHIAVFDTAFHARLPRRSKTYALPKAVREEHGLHRYGFHGTSHGYVTQRAAQHLQRAAEELRLITLHLGNGASACAVEFGHSVETSMGLTPLEGLVMGTRTGDLDPGAVLTLMKSGMNAEQLEELLNHQGGLLGLSGCSSDLRDIEHRAAAGDDACRLAINVFAHRVRKYIGAYAAVLGGVDAIVVTGGIGENSASMRKRILQRFEFLGARFDEDRNSDARVENSGATDVCELHAHSSRVALLVVATNEERMIAEQTQRVIASAIGSGTTAELAAPIPIAVSARHVHVDRSTFKSLFGEGAALTKHKDISQPGQFASEQKVNLIGPRATIEGVRILGPFRKSVQVEVSRTDEFKLGVDAPVRDSGNTRDSAPIILEGPAGRVQLNEGLICARRHIHMPPECAAQHGVKDRDEVDVAITGGPRDLVFGDVLVRVNEQYVLEMHIDTDEANAAELGRAQSGQLVYVPVLQATAGIQSKRAKA